MSERKSLPPRVAAAINAAMDALAMGDSQDAAWHEAVETYGDDPAPPVPLTPRSVEPTPEAIEAAAMGLFRMDRERDEPDWPDLEQTRTAYRDFAAGILRAAYAAQFGVSPGSEA